MSSITEHKLIDIALQIGAIAESNNHHTSTLAASIDSNGTPLNQLTAEELLNLATKCKSGIGGAEL